MSSRLRGKVFRWPNSREIILNKNGWTIIGYFKGLPIQRQAAYQSISYQYRLRHKKRQNFTSNINQNSSATRFLQKGSYFLVIVWNYCGYCFLFDYNNKITRQYRHCDSVDESCKLSVKCYNSSISIILYNGLFIINIPLKEE